MPTAMAEDITEDATENTTNELNGPDCLDEWAAGPDRLDEWAAHLAATAPGPHTASVLPVLRAEELSHTGRIDALKALERHAAWIQAQQADILAALEADAWTSIPPTEWDRNTEAAWNFTCEEVACALKLSGLTAAKRLEVARDLASRYPPTRALLAEGEISYSQAAAVTEACAVLAPEVAEQVEAAVLHKLPAMTTGQTRRVLAREIVRADPDGAEQRHQARKRQRQMVHYPQDDGMAMWGAVLPAEQAAAMTAAVDSHAATLPDEGRTLEQKRVDALYDLVVNRSTASTPEPSGGRSAAVVQVTVPLDVLIGDTDDPAHLKGYGPITAGQARGVAFAEGTVWRRLITHPTTGMLIKTDPTTYKPTAEVERHVVARDAHCTFPTCNMPAHRCDLDHVAPFNHTDPTAGGQTTPDNLTTLCRRHHLMKTHHPGWALKRDSESGTTTWTAPTGHTYTNHPHDYR
ncbi:HNH endonuclease signature motif containing protein [Streptomyces sp. NBRC 110028]|uniref:HNH endonuclease signature motif containing protein n=1 Tax=Streptomyces sp. NBRC 110028 TaxID=1621260 RepID=UPI000AA538ED|nr:HNH endonuclease signature motif containing protein [Streptomyces sp. NBRC 110028]